MGSEQVLQVLDSSGRIGETAGSPLAHSNIWRLAGCLNLCQKPVLVHAVDVEEGVDLEPNYQMPRRRTYYYSIFAARLAIMMVLAVLIGLVTILSWHFTTLYATESINNLAFSLRTQILQRPISRMWNLLNSTTDTITTQVNLAECIFGRHLTSSGSNNFNELSADMRKIIWAVFASRQAVESISITYSNGLVQAFEQGRNHLHPVYVFSLPSPTSQNSSLEVLPMPPPVAAGGPQHGAFSLDEAIWYKEQVDPNTGEGYGSVVQVPSDDVGIIDNYSLISMGKTIWSAKINRDNFSVVISSQAPVRDPSSGAILAVVTVKSILSPISLLMEELVALHGGYMYLTSTEGLLLATSTDSLIVQNTSSGPELMPASESIDPVIRESAQWLIAKDGDKVLLQQEFHENDVLLAGERFYIDSFRLNLTSFPLVGFSILPRSFVMSGVDDRSHTTLTIVIPVAICILVVGCVSILILTSGVSTEMELRAEVIKHLDARRKAEASSNYKSQFLANMSHELRTPMAAVIGLLDILLSDDDLSAEQVTMVSQIRRCSTALLRLLNNILDLSKVESGKLVLEETDFDLGHELEGLVDMFSVQCVDHNIEIVLDLADDIPQVVRGDSARTVQIFANLISNSIKFTSSGHVVLRGRCELASSGVTKDGVFTDKDNYFSVPSTFGKGRSHRVPNSQRFDKVVLWFEVDDSGCGIDPSKWESIFDSFVQADPSTTRTYGGTGLGLCIVRSLVEKMGGEIKVAKKESAGTLIRLCLTFDQPYQLDARLQRPQALPFPADLEQSRVLIAMKGDAGRSTLVKWMTKKRVQVYEASDWDDAVAVLCKFARREPYFKSECSTEEATAVNNSETSSQHECERHWRRWSFRRLSGGRAEKESCATSTRFFAKQGSLEDFAVPGNVDMDIFRPRSNSTPLMSLAVLDVDLLPSGPNSLKASSMMLDHFRNQGVLISWILNHDTSSAVKMELRKLGYTMMVHKPLYKSKLFMLLTSMVGNHAITVPDLDDFISNLGPYSVHMEARDGLSPGSRMSFDLGPASSTQINQQLGNQSSQQSMLGPSQVLESKIAQRLFETSKAMLTPKDLMETQKRIHSDGRHRVSRIVSHDASSSSNKDHDNYLLVQSESGEWEIKPDFLDCQEDSTPQESTLKVLSGSWERNSAAAVGVLYENNLRSNYPLPQQVMSPLLTMKRGATHPTSKVRQDNKLMGTLRSNAGTSGLLGEPAVCHEPHLDEPDILAQKVKGSPMLQSKSIGSNSRQAVNRSEVGIISSSEEGSRAVQPGMKPPKSSSSIKSHECSPVVSRLPSKRWTVDQMGSRGISFSSQLGRRDALKGIRILLAEDTPVLQKVATIMLEKMGATVFAVGDGLQAVEVLLGKPGKGEGHVVNQNNQERKLEETERSIPTFDLVLMDCQVNVTSIDQ
ncbi:hypothetical protein O6H91_21G012600 [Diphasiastrum complanatum]|uniref:Uncharacterized protein n=1 Tax=Diphasiastrum complanatum TaxID=34168 RepID=A0ACC2AJR6_DIPCM|nr:hypothetical protein O6H91_21G012600 [Diphasiastrum complanatum]